MSNSITKAGFVNLSVVRSISGLVVVVAHYFQIFVMPIAGRAPATNFAIGAAEPAVFSFFVLSGFLIALSIQKNLERNEHFDWKAYFLSRFARIYPALVASVLLCIGLHYALVALGHATGFARPTDIHMVSRTEFALNWDEVKYTLLQTYAFGPGSYMTANGPLWSLSYEVGFYLAAGLVVMVLRGKRLARLVALVLLAVLTNMAVESQRYMFLHYATLWLLGVCLFFVVHKRFGYFALLFGFSTAINFLFVHWKLGESVLQHYLSSLLIALLLYVLGRSQKTVLEPLAKLADSTYTIYLFHFALLLALYPLVRDLFDRSAMFYVALTAGLTVVIVAACHELAKFLENRRWWEALLSGKALR